MGKTLALAMPFILGLLLLGYVLVYKAGKRKGKQEAPQRANQVGNALLLGADQIFADLMYIDDVENDDILTEKSRKTVNTWRSDYMKAKHKL